jgi:hypothetical protein
MATAPPPRNGQYAARFQLDRDDPIVSSSKRAELSQEVPSSVPERIERWYGFSIYLPAANQPDPEWVQDASAEILTQWHQPDDIGESPPLAILTLNDQWQIAQAWEDFDLVTPVGNFVTGKWTDWILHVRWSSDPDGLIEAFRDGQQVFSKAGKNKYNDGRAVYMKFGIYKWDWRTNPDRSTINRRVMLYDSLRIADETGTAAEVDPAGQQPPTLILRPQADVAQWTVHGAPTASQALSAAAKQPTPVAAGRYIWAGAPGRVIEITAGVTSTGQGSSAEAWFYANTGADTRLRVEVVWRGKATAAAMVDPGQPFAWRSISFPLASADDELRLRFISIDGGDTNVRAAYFLVRT